jgi:thioredoxin-related protein
MESNDMWLVLFVSASNSYESIKSEWEQADKELSGKVNMGKVFSKDLASQWGVKSFPTIIYFQAGYKSDDKYNENYEGDIKANDIVTWALEKYNGEPMGKYR